MVAFWICVFALLALAFAGGTAYGYSRRPLLWQARPRLATQHVAVLRARARKCRREKSYQKLLAGLLEVEARRNPVVEPKERQRRALARYAALPKIAGKRLVTDAMIEPLLAWNTQKYYQTLNAYEKDRAAVA